MRPGPRLWTAAAIAAGAVAIAPPALAVARPGVEAPADVATIQRGLPRALEKGAEFARAEHRAAERLAHPGPFVPVVGRPDYGSAENRFGAPRSDHVHAGQDMFAPPGTAVVAVTGGVVADAGTDGEQGNYVYLYDPRRARTYVYMHLIEPASAKPGERVRAGERLGGVGCTGSCWGDHLHFEVRSGRGIAAAPRDPLPLLREFEPLRRPR